MGQGSTLHAVEADIHVAGESRGVVSLLPRAVDVCTWDLPLDALNQLVSQDGNVRGYLSHIVTAPLESFRHSADQWDGFCTAPYATLLTSAVDDGGNRCTLFHQKESCALDSAEFMCAGSKVCGFEIVEIDGHMTDCGCGITEPKVSFPHFWVFGEQNGTFVNLPCLVVGIHLGDPNS